MANTRPAEKRSKRKASLLSEENPRKKRRIAEHIEAVTREESMQADTMQGIETTTLAQTSEAMDQLSATLPTTKTKKLSKGVLRRHEAGQLTKEELDECILKFEECTDSQNKFITIYNAIHQAGTVNGAKEKLKKESNLSSQEIENIRGFLNNYRLVSKIIIRNRALHHRLEQAIAKLPKKDDRPQLTNFMRQREQLAPTLPIESSHSSAIASEQASEIIEQSTQILDRSDHPKKPLQRDKLTADELSFFSKKFKAANIATQDKIIIVYNAIHQEKSINGAQEVLQKAGMPKSERKKIAAFIKSYRLSVKIIARDHVLHGKFKNLIADLPERISRPKLTDWVKRKNSLAKKRKKLHQQIEADNSHLAESHDDADTNFTDINQVEIQNNQELNQKTSTNKAKLTEDKLDRTISEFKLAAPTEQDKFIIIYNAIHEGVKLPEAQEILSRNSQISHNDIFYLRDFIKFYGMTIRNIIRDRALHTAIKTAITELPVNEDRPKLTEWLGERRVTSREKSRSIAYLEENQTYQIGTDYQEGIDQEITGSMPETDSNLLSTISTSSTQLNQQDEFATILISLSDSIEDANHNELNTEHTPGSVPVISPDQNTHKLSHENILILPEQCLQEHLPTPLLGEYVTMQIVEQAPIIKETITSAPQSPLPNTIVKRKLTQADIELLLTKFESSNEKYLFIIFYNAIYKKREIKKAQKRLKRNYYTFQKEIENMAEFLQSYGLTVEIILEDQTLHDQLAATLKKLPDKNSLPKLIKWKQPENKKAQSGESSPTNLSTVTNVIVDVINLAEQQLAPMNVEDNLLNNAIIEQHRSQLQEASSEVMQDIPVSNISADRDLSVTQIQTEVNSTATALANNESANSQSVAVQADTTVNNLEFDSQLDDLSFLNFDSDFLPNYLGDLDLDQSSILNNMATGVGTDITAVINLQQTNMQPDSVENTPLTIEATLQSSAVLEANITEEQSKLFIEQFKELEQAEQDKFIIFYNVLLRQTTQFKEKLIENFKFSIEEVNNFITLLNCFDISPSLLMKDKNFHSQFSTTINSLPKRSSRPILLSWNVGEKNRQENMVVTSSSTATTPTLPPVTAEPQITVEASSSSSLLTPTSNSLRERVGTKQLSSILKPAQVNSLIDRLLTLSPHLQKEFIILYNVVMADFSDRLSAKKLTSNIPWEHLSLATKKEIKKRGLAVYIKNTFYKLTIRNIKRDKNFNLLLLNKFNPKTTAGKNFKINAYATNIKLIKKHGSMNAMLAAQTQSLSEAVDRQDSFSDQDEPELLSVSPTIIEPRIAANAHSINSLPANHPSRKRANTKIRTDILDSDRVNSIINDLLTLSPCLQKEFIVLYNVIITDTRSRMTNYQILQRIPWEHLSLATKKNIKEHGLAVYIKNTYYKLTIRNIKRDKNFNLLLLNKFNPKTTAEENFKINPKASNIGLINQPRSMNEIPAAETQPLSEAVDKQDSLSDQDESELLEESSQDMQDILDQPEANLTEIPLTYSMQSHGENDMDTDIMLDDDNIVDLLQAGFQSGPVDSPALPTVPAQENITTTRITRDQFTEEFIVFFKMQDNNKRKEFYQMYNAITSTATNDKALAALYEIGFGTSLTSGSSLASRLRVEYNKINPTIIKNNLELYEALVEIHREEQPAIKQKISALIKPTPKQKKNSKANSTDQISKPSTVAESSPQSSIFASSKTFSQQPFLLFNQNTTNTISTAQKSQLIKATKNSMS